MLTLASSEQHARETRHDTHPLLTASAANPSMVLQHFDDLQTSLHLLLLGLVWSPATLMPTLSAIFSNFTRAGDALFRLPGLAPRPSRLSVGRSAVLTVAWTWSTLMLVPAVLALMPFCVWKCVPKHEDQRRQSQARLKSQPTIDLPKQPAKDPPSSRREAQPRRSERRR